MTTNTQPEVLNTAGTIAKRGGIALWRVRYVIDRFKLVPEKQAGNALIYSGADADFILEQIKRIDRNRDQGVRL